VVSLSNNVDREAWRQTSGQNYTEGPRQCKFKLLIMFARLGPRDRQVRVDIEDSTEDSTYSIRYSTGYLMQGSEAKLQHDFYGVDTYMPIRR
jgi:hypothetical protein